MSRRHKWALVEFRWNWAKWTMQVFVLSTHKTTEAASARHRTLAENEHRRIIHSGAISATRMREWWPA